MGIWTPICFKGNPHSYWKGVKRGNPDSSDIWFLNVICNQTWESLNIPRNPKILPCTKCHISVINNNYFHNSTSTYFILSDAANSKREWQFVKPNTQAQSIRILISKNPNWALIFRNLWKSDYFIPSTIATSNEWFPNQFLHPNKRNPQSSFSSNSYKNIYFVFINHILVFFFFKSL